MERNNPVNSVYLITLALCSAVLVVDSLVSALIFGIVIVASFLISVSVVSMIEKVAEKNIRFLMLALVSAAIVTILKVVSQYIGVREIMDAGEKLEFACLPCLLLGIVPIYFENQLSVKEFFTTSLLISLGTFVMILLWGSIIEIFGYGSFAGVSIKGFDGLEFFRYSYGSIMVLAGLSIIFNICRRWYLKKTRRFNMLVDKYKIQIREIRDTQIRVRAGERRDYNE